MFRSLNVIGGEILMMTKILQKKSINIKCPHCHKVIQLAWVCEMNSMIGMRYAFLCSNCQKLLGISESGDFASQISEIRNLKNSNSNF